ncbi:hypothetical protein H9N25_08670 [Pedobacter riviphilus]|uniref:Uncharacterized protein n=1 Tax=Pedobacter riviphilus TaxID=2766984 RepID=A0ABX6TLL5_9SPHI|nr:hypothetical protein [Pedobacter riviphilus]QNR86448.1 hypothetical protein H9N25_08670 [Pedobacter riviphilus]
MRKNNLLASVALFRKLYDKEDYNNIYDILAEFIRGAVIYENKLTYTSEEIKGLLKKVYGFEIPESVIKTTLRNRFDGKLSKISNSYTFQSTVKDNFEKIEEELDTVNNQNESLIRNLYQYISNKLKKDISKEEEAKIFENFTHFTMDNGYSDQYSELIGAFVVSNQNNTDFTNNLSSIREGIILYQGLSYTADLNELGKWGTDLDIFLAPEHLFNALGYNGILFKEIFDDFYNLVSDINRANKPTAKNREKKIRLFYLPETKGEIDGFFFIGEKIISGKKTIDPSKNAMEALVKNANTISDIKTKQVNFYNQLKLMGIVEYDIEFDAAKHARYNVVDQNVIKEIEVEAKKNKRPFDEEFCHNQLVLFSKINLKRLGKNSFPFEKISDIYITENAVSKYLAHNNAVKFQKEDTAFAKDIDFAIARFWFKLKKGFNTGNHLPKSFDLINKAKIIISSYTNNTVAREYHKINKQFKEGNLTEEDVVRLNIELKEKNNVPEYVSENNIDETLDFLKDDNFIENIKREVERKNTKLDELGAKLAEYERKEEEQNKIKIVEENERRYKQAALAEWKEYENKGWDSFRYFGVIVLLNIFLAALAFLFAFNIKMKNWLTEFNFVQILVAVIYVLFILIEILGSKYIFNKAKILEGYNWMLCIFSLQQEKQKHLNKTIEKLKEIDNS